MHAQSEDSGPFQSMLAEIHCYMGAIGGGNRSRPSEPNRQTMTDTRKSAQLQQAPTTLKAMPRHIICKKEKLVPIGHCINSDR